MPLKIRTVTRMELDGDEVNQLVFEVTGRRVNPVREGRVIEGYLIAHVREYLSTEEQDQFRKYIKTGVSNCDPIECALISLVERNELAAGKYYILYQWE